MSDANKAMEVDDQSTTINHVNIPLLVTVNGEGATSSNKDNKNKDAEDPQSEGSETDDSDSEILDEAARSKAKRISLPQSQIDLKCPEPNIGSFPYQYLCGAYKYSTHLSFWTVDESKESGIKFWNLYGKAIATKNLWISIGNLFLAFAIWLIWSVVCVFLLEAWEGSDGELYAFSSWKENMTKHEYHEALWLLPATAGLSGASLRLTNSFMIASSGGRNVISQTSILLLLPMVLLVVALNDPNVSLEYLMLIALLTGAGGGACSSSLSNISFFYPSSKQGLALGLNAGIGNLGVSLMQFVLPLIVNYPVFGSASIKVDVVGYIANSAIFWIPFLVIFIFCAWFFMNSLPQHPAAKNTVKALISYYYLEFIGYLGAGIAVIVLVATHSFMKGHGMHTVRALILWVLAVGITVLAMKYLLFCSCLGSTKKNIQKTLVVLSMKHTWIMTNLYTMTFGSFIGFSASFALLTKDLFPAVDPLHYAWLGPFVASIARPLGGWLSDKYGGGRVTHWDVVVMILSTIGVGVTLILQEEHSDFDFFPIFLSLFMVLFITTGIGNGSTFRMVPIIFTNKEHAGPILGWAAAISAYGAFVIPIILSECVEIGIGEWAFFGFAIYYTFCLGTNWWFYYRTGAEIPC